MVSTGELNEVETYDVDFDHQFLETEKYDAKPTYKKFLGYRPGVYVIGDMIVYVENSDGNTNVRFYQAETHKRFFALLEANSIRVNRFRADCGSCSKEIVSEIEKHCTHFYIRANRCSSLYDDLFSLRGWKTEEINGIQFELNSILVEKWEGKCYRLVIQRQSAWMESLTCGKVNTPTDAFLPTIMTHQQETSSNFTTSVGAKSVYSMI